MTADKNPQSLEPPDDFEQMFAELNAPEAKMKFERKHQYQWEVLYAGLTNLNTGFDAPLVGHFSPEDFLIVIDRCESLGVEVNGVEVVTTADVEPPYRAALEDIEVSPEEGYNWARRLIRKYMETPAITICATFHVPDKLLKPISKQAGEVVVSELRVKAAEHDASFQAKIQKALDDPSPLIPNAEVEAHFAKRRADALAKVKK